jgi:hypothetical protein
MKTYRPKLAQIVKTTDIGEIVPSIFDTLRTCGAFREQLEFDNGLEFTSAVSENKNENTTHKDKPKTQGYEAVSLKTRRVNNED